MRVRPTDICFLLLVGFAYGIYTIVLIQKASIDIVSVDSEQLSVARQARRKYGKGRHPAALNFGDCFAYALSKISTEPLLARGTDFQKTDLQLL
jgi:ribonuclease VapC